MSGILEQAIQYLQTQQQAMQSMMGSGGGSSGGIGDLFPQTPMTGGGQTQTVSQPSTMEVPTPPVTAPPVQAPPVATTPPVTNTTPVSTPPAPASTPTAPVASTNPVSLGDLINNISGGYSQQTPQQRFANTDIDLGFFDSDEYTQSQEGPQTMDMGYTSDYGFGSGLSSSRGGAQDQAYEDYLKRTGQGDMITREQIAPTTPQLPAFQQNFLDQINQIGVPKDTSLSSAQQERFRKNLQQDLQRKGGIAGLGQIGFGGDPRFAGLGQMDRAQQIRLMQQAQMQMMKQRQALPAQQPQPSSMAGMNLGVGLNPMFGRAFAGKPV